MNNSINAFLDKRYPKKDDAKQFPISLRVYLNSKQFMISMGLYATQADFDKATSGKSGSDKVNMLRTTIYANMMKAQGLLDGLPNIDADKFKRLYNTRQ